MCKVSVITTFHNSKNTIKQAVESILNQTYHDLEYVLVNDGSDDNSVQIVRGISDKRIRLIEPGNVGRAAALNVGLESSVGEYVAILDADDIAIPTRLSSQVNELDSNNSVSLVCANAILIDENDSRIGKTTFPVNHEELVKSLLHLNPFPHSSVMYRRKYADQVGGYNIRCEKSIDYNFYLELLLAGGQLSGHQEPLIYLRSYPTSWGKNDKHGLQIRYGILGVINYFNVSQGGKSFMRNSKSEWAEVKSVFDRWFDEHKYQNRMAAKNTLAKIRGAIKVQDLSALFENLVITFKLDPWFWRYRGCGFRYPTDAVNFLNIFHKKISM